MEFIVGVEISFWLLFVVIRWKVRWRFLFWSCFDTIVDYCSDDDSRYSMHCSAIVDGDSWIRLYRYWWHLVSIWEADGTLYSDGCSGAAVLVTICCRYHLCDGYGRLCHANSKTGGGRRQTGGYILCCGIHWAILFCPVLQAGTSPLEHWPFTILVPFIVLPVRRWRCSRRLRWRRPGACLLLPAHHSAHSGRWRHLFLCCACWCLHCSIMVPFCSPSDIVLGDHTIVFVWPFQTLFMLFLHIESVILEAILQFYPGQVGDLWVLEYIALLVHCSSVVLELLFLFCCLSDLAFWSVHCYITVLFVPMLPFILGIAESYVCWCYPILWKLLLLKCLNCSAGIVQFMEIRYRYSFGRRCCSYICFIRYCAPWPVSLSEHSGVCCSGSGNISFCGHWWPI